MLATRTPSAPQPIVHGAWQAKSQNWPKNSPDPSLIKHTWDAPNKPVQSTEDPLSTHSYPKSCPKWTNLPWWHKGSVHNTGHHVLCCNVMSNGCLKLLPISRPVYPKPFHIPPTPKYTYPGNDSVE